MTTSNHISPGDMFILSAERDTRDSDPAEPWRRYERYLELHRDRFPPSAYTLATSSWYYNFNDHRCPHDAWLEEAVIREPARGLRREIRTVELRLRLLGAYHDGHIEMRYPQVFRYELGAADVSAGHRDWRYDEFRIGDDGRLIHEIEWCGPEGVARWLIEASDVEFGWHPGA